MSRNFPVSLSDTGPTVPLVIGYDSRSMGTGTPSAPIAMSKSAKPKPDSINIRDYPSMMSLYEKESLAAEAQLKAERYKKTAKKSPQTLTTHYSDH
jgi:hypothetical protein